MKQEIDFLLYSMPDTEGSVQVVVKDETAWRSQKAMAQLFGVGYRVSSVRATKFRQWATQVLREYIRKGFAMDDERLKQGTAFFLARITSGSCWSVSVPSARVSAASGSKSPTSMLSAALTTTKGNTFTLRWNNLPSA